jgi:effector-binding domain-containing protein
MIKVEITEEMNYSAVGSKEELTFQYKLFKDAVAELEETLKSHGIEIGGDD